MSLWHLMRRMCTPMSTTETLYKVRYWTVRHVVRLRLQMVPGVCCPTMLASFPISNTIILPVCGHFFSRAYMWDGWCHKAPIWPSPTDAVQWRGLLPDAHWEDFHHETEHTHLWWWSGDYRGGGVGTWMKRVEWCFIICIVWYVWLSCSTHEMQNGKW